MYVRGLRDGTAEDALYGFKVCAGHMHRLLCIHNHAIPPWLSQFCLVLPSPPSHISAWLARCQQPGVTR